MCKIALDDPGLTRASGAIENHCSARMGKQHGNEILTCHENLDFF